MKNGVLLGLYNHLKDLFSLVCISRLSVSYVSVGINGRRELVCP